MDLHAERQCIDELRGGELKKLLLLYDANFDGLYKYVLRRVGDSQETERIIRTTFLDAIGQAKNTPMDVQYLVWLYSLAKPRVWEYINEVSFPRDKGLIFTDKQAQVQSEDVLVRAENMIKKLSLEEREILRLKFFEEVTDGDVMTILGITDGSIGAKIYRVLKRSHFLLFGESDSRQGVYFGELSGFLAQIRELEKIGIPQALKIDLCADLLRRIEKREVDAEIEVEAGAKTEAGFGTEREIELESESGREGEEREGNNLPFKQKEPEPVYSNDPAKIYVEAVKQIKREEEEEAKKNRESFERGEKILEFVDKWKYVLAIVPIVFFIGIVSVVVYYFVDFSGGGAAGDKVTRGYPTICSSEVVFNGDFSDGERRSLNKDVSDAVCGSFDVKELEISKIRERKVMVNVDIDGGMIEYRFVRKNNEWRIVKYAKTSDSDQKSGKIYRNSRVPRGTAS